MIRGKDGKDVAFKIGKNVEITPDGLSVIAKCDGSIVNENDKLSVIKVLEIKTDVGVETGILNFMVK